MAEVSPGAGVPHVSFRAFVQLLTEACLLCLIHDTLEVARTAEGIGVTAFRDAGEFPRVPLARILAHPRGFVVHEDRIRFVDAGERLLDPATRGENAGVVLRAVLWVSEDADAAALRKTRAVPALAHDGVEDVVLGALVDNWVGFGVLAEEELAGVVVIHLELVGLGASAFLWLGGIADAAAELRLPDGAHVAVSAGLGVGGAVHAVDQGLAVDAHEFAQRSLASILELWVGSHGAPFPGMAGGYLWKHIHYNSNK